MFDTGEREARRNLESVERQVAELEERRDRDARDDALLRNLKRERAAWRASVRSYEARRAR